MIGVRLAIVVVVLRFFHFESLLVHEVKDRRGFDRAIRVKRLLKLVLVVKGSSLILSKVMRCRSLFESVIEFDRASLSLKKLWIYFML